MTTNQSERIIRIKAVLALTGLSRTSLYRKIQLGTFPRQIALSQRCVGWRQSAVSEWIRTTCEHSEG
jgi:prophage regulatory protein